jgi:DnaK suppressor protein
MQRDKKMRRSEAISRLRHVLVRRRDCLWRSLDAELAFMGLDPDEPEGDEVYCRAAELESRELAAIDDALTRMREGRYGVCEGCGENISLARLQALPDATYCIRCQHDMEQHRAAPLLPRRRFYAIELVEDAA